jgi:peptidoglycan/xylan/chitin deacetylase (PgdA/CDA1 family)
MYHNVVNQLSSENKYTGGNVDSSGYSRTVEAFKQDLEFYYQSGYQMIKLKDYINKVINVDLGKSPIILTFDDGNKDNMNILGIDEKGNLIIDPNCAVGILESFKSKYPDFSVTATFFLHSNLFGQIDYNEKILKWLVDNNYDIGNHTRDHVDFTKIDLVKTQKEVAYMYKLFDSIIPLKYIHVVALPFGSPYKKSHENFPYILEGAEGEYRYITDTTLRVGWDADYSPFHQKFDKTFLKRVRAWDNNGLDFDIEYVFKNLESNRYISDGNIDTIVIPDDTNLNINIKDKKIIKY